jgi:flagellar motor switch protein FliM
VLSVAKPACLFTFQIGNMDIRGILELNSELALNFVDRLLGGLGKGAKQTKMITPIEQEVLNVVVERIMLDLKKSWQSVDNLDFQVEAFEPDIDFAQITSQNEAVLVISFELIIAEQSHMMNLCFATFAFDSILAKMSSQKFSSVKPVKYKGTTAREIISGHLCNTTLPVVVEFGHARITVQELMELKAGDIIRLDNKINDDHIVKVSSIKFFAGRGGITNNHKAIKITKMLYGGKK